MKFVFWQNILSPHQSDFISQLSEKHDVTLVVAAKTDKQRKESHWNAKYSEKTKIIVKPSLSEIFSMIFRNDKSIIHVFSGFIAYPVLSFALIMSCLKSKNNIVISEAVPTVGFWNKSKLLIRTFMGILLKKRIKHTFAIGSAGVKYFLKLGFSSQKLHEFAYFVSPPKDIEEKLTPPLVIFVGRLIELKGIFPLLDSFKLLEKHSKHIDMKIIGSGVLSHDIESFILKNNLKNVCVNEDMPRVQVMKFIGQASCLILPNTGDEGWGVVVNEALLQGTPVIVSNKTGASLVVKNDLNGVLLDNVDGKSIFNGIQKCLSLDYKEIIDISRNELMPEEGVEFFINQIESSEPLLAPWKKD